MRMLIIFLLLIAGVMSFTGCAATSARDEVKTRNDFHQQGTDGYRFVY